jgi:hypothetical protein
MEFSTTTPALLFPAISLIMLAYTNRFFGLANLIRNLRERYDRERKPALLSQIDNLRTRIRLLRDMQALGSASFLLCVLSMGCAVIGQLQIGQAVFIAALVLMAISFALSLREISMSVGALDLELRDLQAN